MDEDFDFDAVEYEDDDDVECEDEPDPTLLGPLRMSGIDVWFMPLGGSTYSP